MLNQLLLFIAQTVVSFFTALLLFRFYCLLIRLNLKWSAGNLGLFVFQVTDWLVLPIRRLIPAVRHIDLACLLAAFLVQCIYTLLKFALLTGGFYVGLNIILTALFDLFSASISGLTGLVFVSALLTWFSVNEQIKNLLDQLVYPVLRPFRSLIPLVAGVDISPLAALLFFQLLNIVLQGLRFQLAV
jgi:YggT family protein